MSEIVITYNGTLDIATGRSRKETNWRNKEFQWSDLIERLSNTHRTAETHTEYTTAKKIRQDEIKDIGGFVGGYLTSGRRKSGSVLHRQLITLDIDYGKADFWFDFELMYGNAAVLYSTHKHSPEAPRLRLIIPLDRPVMVDEYMAISRKIAGILDIEAFDPTTFQPERLMYWPSTSKDGIYEFQYQDGPWMCADDILNKYRDWRDSSEWPVSSRVDKLVQRSITKQGDPLEKPGVIGAWCRTYTIAEVIENCLSDVYDPCAIEDRYSYKEGSTAAGLVVYDDKYAFSHHGTDPTSGKLCNAFDLVRLHKFGLRDEDAREGTAPNRLPSYTAMVEMASKDPKVKKMIVNELLNDARGDFADMITEEESQVPGDDKWKEKLDVDRKGNIYSTIDNVLLIFENDIYFKGKMAYDDFEKCEVAIKDLPWRKVDNHTRRLIDKDDSNIRHYLEKTYGISNLAKTRDAMEVLSQKTSFHPVRKYLQSTQWDGQPRIDSLLIDYQGAEDNEYTRTVTRKALVAAVARIFNPGVKFDNVLSLIGEQGLKKSSLLAKLGQQWFSDSFSTIEGKESFEQLQGVWIVEVAEMAALAKAEVEKIKHFISKQEDRYRVAFGRRTEKFPRQCIFFITTNKMDFMKDQTGGRRFWPVRVNVVTPEKDVFKDLTQDEVNQVWAEAMYLYKKGESIYLPEHMIEVATNIQKEHTEEHPWTGIIQQYLDVKLPACWQTMSLYERRAYLQGDDELLGEGIITRNRVCVLEIWQEAIKGKDTIDERANTAIRNVMRNMAGWKEEPKQIRYGIYGANRKGFVRVGTSDIAVTTPVTPVTAEHV